MHVCASEIIHQKEGGPDRYVSNNIFSSRKRTTYVKHGLSVKFTKVRRLILFCRSRSHYMYGDSPVNRGIPLTDAISKKATFHTSFSSRSSLFQSMCMMYCVNRNCNYLSKLSCFLHKFIGFIKIMRFPTILALSRPYTFINTSLLK